MSASASAPAAAASASIPAKPNATSADSKLKTGIELLPFDIQTRIPTSLSSKGSIHGWVVALPAKYKVGIVNTVDAPTRIRLQINKDKIERQFLCSFHKTLSFAKDTIELDGKKHDPFCDARPNLYALVQQKDPLGADEAMVETHYRYFRDSKELMSLEKTKLLLAVDPIVVCPSYVTLNAHAQFVKDARIYLSKQQQQQAVGAAAAASSDEALRLEIPIQWMFHELKRLLDYDPKHLNSSARTTVMAMNAKEKEYATSPIDRKEKFMWRTCCRYFRIISEIRVKIDLFFRKSPERLEERKRKEREEEELKEKKRIEEATRPLPVPSDANADKERNGDDEAIEDKHPMSLDSENKQAGVDVYAKAWVPTGDQLKQLITVDVHHWLYDPDACRKFKMLPVHVCDARDKCIADLKASKPSSWFTHTHDYRYNENGPLPKADCEKIEEGLVAAKVYVRLSSGDVKPKKCVMYTMDGGIESFPSEHAADKAVKERKVQKEVARVNPTGAGFICINANQTNLLRRFDRACFFLHPVTKEPRPVPIPDKLKQIRERESSKPDEKAVAKALKKYGSPTASISAFVLFSEDGSVSRDFKTRQELNSHVVVVHGNSEFAQQEKLDPTGDARRRFEAKHNDPSTDRLVTDTKTKTEEKNKKKKKKTSTKSLAGAKRKRRSEQEASVESEAEEDEDDADATIDLDADDANASEAHAFDYDGYKAELDGDPNYETDIIGMSDDDRLNMNLKMEQLVADSSFRKDPVAFAELYLEQLTDDSPIADSVIGKALKELANKIIPEVNAEHFSAALKRKAEGEAGRAGLADRLSALDDNDSDGDEDEDEDEDYKEGDDEDEDIEYESQKDELDEAEEKEAIRKRQKREKDKTSKTKTASSSSASSRPQTPPPMKHMASSSAGSIPKLLERFSPVKSIRKRTEDVVKSDKSLIGVGSLLPQVLSQLKNVYDLHIIICYGSAPSWSVLRVDRALQTVIANNTKDQKSNSSSGSRSVGVSELVLINNHEKNPQVVRNVNPRTLLSSFQSKAPEAVAFLKSDTMTFDDRKVNVETMIVTQILAWTARRFVDGTPKVCELTLDMMKVASEASTNSSRISRFMPLNNPISTALEKSPEVARALGQMAQPTQLSREKCVAKKWIRVALARLSFQDDVVADQADEFDRCIEKTLDPKAVWIAAMSSIVQSLQIHATVLQWVTKMNAREKQARDELDRAFQPSSGVGGDATMLAMSYTEHDVHSLARQRRMEDKTFSDEKQTAMLTAEAAVPPDVREHICQRFLKEKIIPALYKCTICMEEMTVVFNYLCGHKSCGNCIDRIVSDASKDPNKNTCPFCRAAIIRVDAKTHQRILPAIDVVMTEYYRTLRGLKSSVAQEISARPLEVAYETLRKDAFDNLNRHVARMSADANAKSRQAAFSFGAKEAQSIADEWKIAHRESARKFQIDVLAEDKTFKITKL